MQNIPAMQVAVSGGGIDQCKGLLFPKKPNNFNYLTFGQIICFQPSSCELSRILQNAVLHRFVVISNNVRELIYQGLDSLEHGCIARLNIGAGPSPFQRPFFIKIRDGRPLSFFPTLRRCQYGIYRVRGGGSDGGSNLRSCHCCWK